jgi:PBP1b-binding outer membrane lipoprotein LpoB
MRIAVVLLLAVMLTACTGNETPEQTAGKTAPVPGATRESVAAMLVAAQSAQKAAAAAGAEWLETGALIDQAKRDAEQENWDIAIELAMKAKQQGELAVMQAERESNVWHNRVVR